MPGLSNPRYRGIFPVVPTTFGEDGALDLASQRRCVDFMIDSGVDGLCILANFSEQFLVSDEEREILTRAVLEHVAGRVPVIVTTTHASTRVCAERSRRAQDMGAAMVMVMPPYHGATFRFGEAQVRAFYQGVSDRIGIPIMIQDAPAAGAAVARLPGRHGARDRAGLVLQDGNGRRRRQAARADRAGRRGGRGPLGRRGGHYAAGRPGGRRDRIHDWRRLCRRHPAHHRSPSPWRCRGHHAQYQRWLPLINHENRQAGFLAAKALMKEGGVIACDAPRAPWPPLHPETRRQLLAIARRLDPLVLRWGVERKRRAGGAGPIRGRPAGRPPLASGREHSVPLR